MLCSRRTRPVSLTGVNRPEYGHIQRSQAIPVPASAKVALAGTSLPVVSEVRHSPLMIVPLDLTTYSGRLFGLKFYLKPDKFLKQILVNQTLGIISFQFWRFDPSLARPFPLLSAPFRSRSSHSSILTSRLQRSTITSRLGLCLCGGGRPPFGVEPPVY